MSEYWVSQAKYYCKVCNVYMADNKMSRQLHDNGKSHKDKLDALLKKKKQDQLHGARSEHELKQQLAAIEQAAKEAILADRTDENGGFFKQSAGVAPPPPSRAMPSSGNNYSSGTGNKIRRDAEEKEEEDLENNGIYTVKGITYMDGKIHDGLIRSGSGYEIFLEDIDEWIPCVVTSRIDRPIPNTELTVKYFDVAYLLQEKECAEKQIRGDRLRIIATEDGRPLAQVLQEESTKKAEIVEETGLGTWKTVTVRVVDEEQEALEQQLQLLQEKERELELQAIQKANTVTEADLGDSALAAYDPYGKNIYKGFKIANISGTGEYASESLTDGEIVQFKRRKVTASSSSQSAVPTIKQEVVAADLQHSSEDKAIENSASSGFQMTIKKARNFRRKDL